MGREIRRVPKNWEHPQYEQCPHWGGLEQAHMGSWMKPTDYRWGKCYHPLYDKDYETAAQDWVAGFDLWRDGKHPDQADYCKYFWEYSYPPREDYYRPSFTEPADCYQIYETVSEGTPDSPIFETLEEMAEYLTGQGYSEGAAHAFIRDGWVSSAVSYVPDDGSPVQTWMGIESADKPNDSQ